MLDRLQCPVHLVYALICSSVLKIWGCSLRRRQLKIKVISFCHWHKHCLVFQILNNSIWHGWNQSRTFWQQCKSQNCNLFYLFMKSLRIPGMLCLTAWLHTRHAELIPLLCDVPWCIYSAFPLLGHTRVPPHAVRMLMLFAVLTHSD